MTKFNAENLFAIANDFESDTLNEIIASIAQTAVIAAKRRETSTIISMKQIPNQKKLLLNDELIVGNLKTVVEALKNLGFTWSEQTTNSEITKSRDFLLSWDLTSKNSTLITVIDIANEILAVNTSSQFEKLTPITPLFLQILTFFTIREAMHQNLLNEKTIQNIVENDQFMLFKTSPTNESLQRKFAQFSASEINVKIPLNKQLAFLDDIIADQIITRRYNIFDSVNQTLNEPFYKQHRGAIRGWRSNIAYTKDALAYHSQK